LEILGNRWTRLRLATVAEDYPRQKRMIRCRLRAVWSLQAKVAFWTIFGLELLAIGIGDKWLAWLPALLLSMPLFAWFLIWQQRNQQSLMVVLLDGVAMKMNMTRMPFEALEPAPQPAP
jgi:hypothetical protein